MRVWSVRSVGSARPVRSARSLAAVVAAGVVAVVLAGSLAGCSTRTPPEDPRIVWANGEPSGSLEQDPAVKRARAAELAETLAVNSNDFGREDLAETWAPVAVTSMYTARKRDIESGETADLRVFPGPLPWQPTDVGVDDNGNTLVTGCALSGGWYIGENHSAPATPAAMPTRVRFHFDGSDADARVTRIEQSNVECEAADEIAVGRFDPQPSLDTADESVIPPARDEK